MNKIKLVIMRHGESQWNKENRFTGWEDIDLSENGIQEAKKSGKLLKEYGFTFDYAYTSLLKRAIHSLWYILDILDIPWIPIEKSWRLNERHYGALQGLNKTEVAIQYGHEQVELWRRSFSISPPKITKDDLRYPGKDPRYKNLTEQEIPLSESLKSTTKRVVPYWKEVILHNLKYGKKIIIIAHGNSLRGLMKYLNNINDDDISKLTIPTGRPVICEFNNNFMLTKYDYIK